MKLCKKEGQLEKKYFLSFSGGKDSTAMLLRLLELGQPVDEILMVDTGWEFPETYIHIIEVEKLIGRKITMLHPEKSFDYWMYDRVILKGKRIGHKGLGFPRPMIRWCTGEKVRILRNYYKQFYANYDIHEYIGFAYDEQDRIEKRKHAKKKQLTTPLYPLSDWKWDEKQCLEYCLSKGLTWSGHYNIFPRLSCWCCPLQNMKTLDLLRKHYPELWEKLKEMERRSGSTFKMDLSIFEIEQRLIKKEQKRKDENDASQRLV